MTYCPDFFGTLSTALKARIISLLKENDLSVSELTHQIGEERSTISHALKTLKKCGFVYAERKGKYQYYSINKETILPLLTLAEIHMKKHCKHCRK